MFYTNLKDYIPCLKQINMYVIPCECYSVYIEETSQQSSYRLNQLGWHKNKKNK